MVTDRCMTVLGGCEQDATAAPDAGVAPEEALAAHDRDDYRQAPSRHWATKIVNLVF